MASALCGRIGIQALNSKALKRGLSAYTFFANERREKLLDANLSVKRHSDGMEG